MLSVRCNDCIKRSKLGKHLERRRKIKPFLDKFNWESINYTSGDD